MSFFAKSQDTLLIYLDSQWKEVTKEKATFYRKVIKKDKKTWVVNDFFLNGQIQMSGTYNSKTLKEKQGYFVYYYENGQKEHEGNYVNNKKEGEWKFWSQTGEVRMIGSYDSLSHKQGLWKSWYSNGNCNFEGNFLNDVEDKEWKYYFENGSISAKEIYNQGKLTEIHFWNEDGSIVEGTLNIQVMPKFAGGDGALKSYLTESIKYPESARLSSISGKVFVKFIVDENGEIVKPEVLKSVHPLLDNEALRVVKEMPKWIPGRQHNRRVKVQYTIPINFSLN
jgi:TonB family protein